MWMLLHIYHIRENRREREGEGRWGSSIAGRTKAAEIGVHQATATRPPPHRQTSFPPKTSPNFSFRFIKAVGQYSVLMGLSVGNLIARWDEMGLPIYPILGMFGANRFDAVLLPG